MNLFQDIMLNTGVAAGDLTRLINSAPARYKTYFIPKKTGGSRLIAHPSRELKVLQRFILDEYLSYFPIHDSATAYKKGTSIYQNAMAHAQSRAIMKFDFESFFPSLKPRDWNRYLAKLASPELPTDFGLITTYLLFWGEKSREPRSLSIGAPTSPTVSNILMYDLDSAIAEAASTVGITYTRYADDITLSGESTSKLERFERHLRSLVRKTTSPNLLFNEKKRGIYHRGTRRIVTGLVLTPDEHVSIGRDRKRLISAMIYRFKLGKLSPEEAQSLKGWIAFAIANESTFVTSMRHKYGSSMIDEILALSV
jgi:hypothetical protein